MRAGQLVGWALLLFLGVTVYSLVQLHSLSAQHDDSLDARHRFAIDFGHIARRSGPAARAAASGEGDKSSTLSGRWSHAASQLHVGEQEGVVAARLGLVSGSTGSGSSVSDVSTTSASSSSSSSGGGGSGSSGSTSGSGGLASGSTQGHAERSDRTTSVAAQGSEGGAIAAEPVHVPAPEVVVTSRGKCYAYPQVDSWGNALPGSRFKAANAAECCEACLRAQHLGLPDQADCNVWVWCSDQEKCGAMYQDCWVKWMPYLKIAAPNAASMNGSVPWVSGTSIDLDLNEVMHGWRVKFDRAGKRAKAAAAARQARAAAASGAGAAAAGAAAGVTGAGAAAAGAGVAAAGAAAGVAGAGAAGGSHWIPIDPVSLVDTTLKKVKEGVKEPQMYHTVTSVQGKYNQWQTRIHWYHWRKMQAICRAQGPCEMGGYTRLLHSGRPDEIMDEIPTVVVEPMPSTMIKHDDYVVLNRPYAFVTWVKTANIPERYVLMAEPDHIYLRPLPNFMRGDKPAGFNFGYMNPAGDENCPIVKRHTGIVHTPQCEEVAPIGNSPTWLTLEDMRKVVPLWLNLSIAVYQDKEAQKVWGWVQEMYAFAMAVWTSGLKSVDLYGHLVAQPPFDETYELTAGRPFYILHYTYGLDFNTTTGEVLMSKVGDWHFDKREHDPTPIPRNMKEPPDTVDFDLARVLIRSFNEATAAIPCWNEYTSSRGQIVTKDCGEKPGGFLATQQAGAPVSGSIVQ